MARRPSVRYWQSRKAYCCWFQGTQHVLAEGPDDFPNGPTYQTALQKFSGLTCMANASSAKDANTCRVICELYLRHISTRRKEATLKIRQRYFVPFTDELGEVEASHLTHQMVYDWLAKQRQWRDHPQTHKPTRWTNGSVRNACESLQAAFNWAAKTGFISKNPLWGLEAPKARSRGREALLGQDHAERQVNHRRILAVAGKYFRPLILVMEATGCRPSEVANVTAKDFHPKLGAIIYHADDKRNEGEYSHKNATKGKDRIIMLSGEALATVKELVKQNPSGRLFLTRRKVSWTEKMIASRLHTLRDQLELPNLTAYSYRHTFATAWLEQGRSVDILAELLGNSPNVIRKHYSHLLGDPVNLRRQLAAFRDVSALEEESENRMDQPLYEVAEQGD